MMTEEQYKSICTRMDALIAKLGTDYTEDDPKVTELLVLSDAADSYYKQNHQDGYVDEVITLEMTELVTLIIAARKKSMCLNEYVEDLLKEEMDRIKV